MKQVATLLLLALPLTSLAQYAVSGLLIFKVKSEYVTEITEQGPRWTALQNAVEFSDNIDLKRMFPGAVKPAPGEVGRCGLEKVDLSRTYRAEFSVNEDLNRVIALLVASGKVEWAEPTTYAEAMYTPNDPNLANQNHLTLINAFAGWDQTQGDTNVVIGITDTSFDLLHPDLTGNVKYNYADPVNGLDDDNDGYVDNYAGWDVWGNDNNLFFTNEWHGTGVAAVASAKTDNGVGVAGVGFKCKFLPVKIGNDATSSTIITADGYTSIAYCADRGAKVINCSWGTLTYSQAGQDVVNYAVINKDAAVVAAAGNASGTAYRYPASFYRAASVTGVHNSGLFNNGSNPTFTYNDSVDFCAQGFNVYTTATVGAAGGNAVYTTTGGTSLACPQVSGAVALIRSKDSCLTALQAVQLLLDSARVIDDITENLPYAGQMGKLIDVGAALASTPCTLIGQNNMVKESMMLVYPNPSSEIVSIEVKKPGELRVYSIDGKEVLGQTILDKGVHSLSLACGLHFVYFTDGQTIASTKVLIIP